MPGQRAEVSVWRLIAAAQIGCMLPCIALLAVDPARAQADPQPLHVRIDESIAATHIGPVAAPADDAEFLRRIHLDLTGMIPSAADTRAFLADTAPDKRVKLIDRLLASPAYVRHMATTFDLMLMERRSDKHVKTAEWRQYLETSFAAGKPYNQLAAEILAADGTDPQHRAPARFFLDREAEPNLMAREVGRMFFGIDVECAQCHDHPLIDDYLQSDYYGLFAFVSRTYLFQPDTKQPAVLAEKAEGSVTFKSVFTGSEGQTRPRLPGAIEIDEPVFATGNEYQVKPDPKNKNLRPVPKYSRRAQLAKLATDGSNRDFNRNIVNRLWAHMMGRGLVHPVDLHHSDNPPAQPQLLEELADSFVAMKFDVRTFLRELALSNTYQRSFRSPPDVESQVAAARNQLPVAEAEVKQLQATVETARKTVQTDRTARDAAKPALTAALAELTKARTALVAAETALAAATKAQTDFQPMVTAKQQVAALLTETVEKIQAARKSLPEDKELAAVADKFTAKSNQTTTELAALTKTLAERSAAVTAAQQQQTAATTGVTTQTANVDAARKPLTGLNDKLLAAEAALADAVRKLKAAEYTHKQAKLLTAWGDAQAKLTATQTAITGTTAEMTAVQTARNEANTTLAKLQAELPAAQKADADAAAQSATATGNLKARQEIHQLIADSLAKTTTAAGKLPADADLKLVIEKLTIRAAELGKEVTELQQTADTRLAEQKTAAANLTTLTQTIATTTATIADMDKRVAALSTQLQQLQERINPEQSAIDAAHHDVIAQWSSHFAVTPLEALTPEQMAWSMLQATGQYDRQLAASANEINKKTPLSAEDQQDPAKLAARQAEIETAAIAKLQGNVNTFVNLYGTGAGQPQHQFFATVDQALFLANGGQFLSWLAPGAGNLTDRLLKAETPQAVSEELYLTVLTRKPTDTETADIAAYLAAKPDNKKEAVQELAWALLTCSEFRFNH